MGRPLSGHQKLESVSFATKPLTWLCDLEQVITPEALIVLIYKIWVMARLLLSSLHDPILKGFSTYIQWPSLMGKY